MPAQRPQALPLTMNSAITTLQGMKINASTTTTSSAINHELCHHNTAGIEDQCQHNDHKLCH
jgi:hypothetical protein